MLKISQECLNLILLSVSLKISDHETIARLVERNRGHIGGSALYLGLGEADFLAILSDPVSGHPVLELPNTRLAGVIRAHGVVGFDQFLSKEAGAGIALLCCAKLNPKVKSHLGIGATSGILLPMLGDHTEEFSKTGVTVSAYVTTGWPDLVLLLMSNTASALLDAAVWLRNLRANGSRGEPFLFSTTFSQLFFLVNPLTLDLTRGLASEDGSGKFDFHTRIVCKPGGHDGIERMLAGYDLHYLLGKPDVGFTTRSMGAGAFIRSLLRFRATYSKLIYATQSSILFGKAAEQQ